MSSVPLLKALADAGIGPRRMLTAAIRQGSVEVNGKIVEDFRHPVNVETDRLIIKGRPVDLRPIQLIYLMLNKPEGVVSTTKDERGRRTVMDILPEKYRHLRLYPVGRLDKDSTGLLLLTNDGELTHRVTHPRFEHEKEYLVSINTRLQAGDKRKLEQGLAQDGLTHPAQVKEVKTPPFSYSLTLHEGRKRQVRRMFEGLGYHVQALKRFRIGGLRLGCLEEGATRELSAPEAKALLKGGRR